MSDVACGVTTALVVVVAFFFIPLPEAERPSAAVQKDTIASVLKRLDERIYTPKPMTALSFLFRPGSEATGKSGFRIRYRCRDGVGDRIDILGDDDAILEEVPGFEGEEKQRVVREHFLAAGRNIADLVKGRSFTEHYAPFRGDVVKRVVNGEPETSLVLEPREPKKLKGVVLHLDRTGLPWKIDKQYLNRDSVVENPSYEAHGADLVLSKLQHVYTPGTPGQQGFSYAYAFTWQKVSGRLLLATLRKVGNDLPKEAQGTTELVDLRFDADVPEFKAK